MGGRWGAHTHPGGLPPAGERDPAGEYYGSAELPAGEYHGLATGRPVEEHRRPVSEHRGAATLRAGERGGGYPGRAVGAAGEYHAAVRDAKRHESGRHALVRCVMIINGVDLSGGGEPYGAGGAYGWAASGQPLNADVLYSPQVAP